LDNSTSRVLKRPMPWRRNMLIWSQSTMLIKGGDWLLQEAQQLPCALYQAPLVRRERVRQRQGQLGQRAADAPPGQSGALVRVARPRPPRPAHPPATRAKQGRHGRGHLAEAMLPLGAGQPHGDARAGQLAHRWHRWRGEQARLDHAMGEAFRLEDETVLELAPRASLIERRSRSTIR
jgi:hypothetical protein